MTVRDLCFLVAGALAGMGVSRLWRWLFEREPAPAAPPPDDSPGWEDVLAIKDEAERRDAILRRARANPENRTMWDA